MYLSSFVLCRHVGHVGWDPQEGVVVRTLPFIAVFYFDLKLQYLPGVSEKSIAV